MSGERFYRPKEQMHSVYNWGAGRCAPSSNGVNVHGIPVTRKLCETSLISRDKRSCRQNLLGRHEPVPRLTTRSYHAANPRLHISHRSLEPLIFDIAVERFGSLVAGKQSGPR